MAPKKQLKKALKRAYGEMNGDYCDDCFGRDLHYITKLIKVPPRSFRDYIAPPETGNFIKICTP